MKKKKQLVNLLVASTFLVLVVSGLMAYFRPFSIKTTGLHSLMGFFFILLIYLHVKHNFTGLKKSFQGKNLVLTFSITGLLTALFIWQPKPVQAVLGLSNNLGAAQDRFVMNDKGMIYNYTPTPKYKLKIEVRAGKNYQIEKPPQMAIWLQNQSFYHIKTLHSTQNTEELPYWSWKVKEYNKAKKEAEENDGEVLAVSGATPNSSFDPRDYILPERNEEPFYLMIEVNQPGDGNESYQDQPSMIYRIEIDNKYPTAFQVFELMGYSKYDDQDESWQAYYPDGSVTTALKLIDSALLTVERD
ncbi:hypothetical protein LNTAR_06874 [Lentisphaera araneosa HTCC2155]|uniref:DUF4405 domain-containing protein n=1 Tax=Lentisphaera araneosa HTCC2155 TaxID=313628 RepID=A6DMR0_9BACT|nr:DUF4405 domain-containing protein [Lentisphaera araneosa]EDM26946.1 hypothetical protein LNTAR_06874 [Lentisphaera araneosa HTCC2155]